MEDGICELRAAFHPPSSILHPLFVVSLASVLVLAGCTPAGPRALLQGERLLNEGQYPEAVEQLKRATVLLNTNALAWNYLGLAYHHAGDSTDAAQAYQQALKLNRDLVETHFNLGCLWLEQNRLDNAKAEFSAFTLRRGNSVVGWLKLGSAQLRSHELIAAEKSFNEALRFSPQNPEALNGLGLIQIQRNRSYEASQFFNSALQQQPDYAPALLNLAIVSQASLNNRTLALQKYREYLALPARPANWEAVNATASALDQDIKSNSHVTSTAGTTPPVSNAAPVRAASNLLARASVPVKPEPTSSVARPVQVATTKVASPPEARVANDVSPATARNSQSDTNWDEPPPGAKPGFFQRLFHTSPKETSKVTTIPSAPAASGETPRGVSESAVSVASSAPVAVNVARYKYHSLPKPVAGKRLVAEKYFLQGLQSQRAGELSAAIQAYNQATALDPAYFEAYYNLGLAATAAGDLPQALSAGEYALAIRPDSTEARLNFAQLLKQVNYFFDAADQLATVLSKSPNEARAHLALGNLYAQQFHQPAQAREHYLKVLESDPRNSQAPAIREWLVANPR